jgi:hypothetical protein
MHTKYQTTLLGCDYQAQAGLPIGFLDKFKTAMKHVPSYSADVEKIMQNMEQVVYLAYCLASASTNAERARHLAGFILYRSKGSVAKRAIDFLTNKIPELFGSGYMTQADDLRGLLDNWDRANESTLATKLRAVASYCMAFSMLEQCGFTPAFAEIMYAEFRVQKETKKVTSFIYAILDVAEFVMSRARICWESKSLGPLFHSSSTYLDWFSKVDEVRHLSHTRGSPDDVEGLRDIKYFALLEDCIAKGESMVQFTKTSAERKSMQALVNELKIMRHNCGIEQAVSRPREEPLGILIPGDPGVGKSSLTQMLGRIYASVRGLDFNASSRFDRNPFDAFMSGFKSCMWFIVMDDVACLDPKKCPSGDLSLADVIQLINCAPYTSNQAELEKKGKVPVLAKLVIANTNVLHMNVFEFFSHPSAVQRRFKLVITPYVKEGFRRQNEAGESINMLDGDKATAWYEAKKAELGEDPMPDYWDFELLQWLPTPIGGEKRLATNYYPFGRNEAMGGRPNRVGLQVFIDFYTTLICKHIENQTKMLKNLEAMKVVGICSVCNSLTQHCTNRAAHVVFDDVECRDCKKLSCYHKHECGMCEHDAFRHRCTKGCAARCPHGKHPEFCPDCAQHNVESEVTCQCSQPTCLWKYYPEAIHSVCPTCFHCQSEEDVMEGTCTVCLVQQQYAQGYRPQSDLGIAGWFGLYIVAFLLQLKKMCGGDMRAILPPNIAAQRVQLENATAAGLTVANYVEGAIGTYNNVYEQWAHARHNLLASAASAQEFLKNRPSMLLVGAAVTLLAVFKKGLHLYTKFEAQSDASIPTPVDEKADPWKVDNYALTPVDVGRKTCNSRQWTKQDVCNNLGNNVFVAEVATKSGVRRTRLLAVADRYYLVNAHAFGGGTSGTLRTFRNARSGVHDGAHDIPIEEHMLTPIGPDVLIMHLPQLPPRRNIIEFFAKESFCARTHGYYVGISNACEPELLEVRNARPCNFAHASLNNGQPMRVYEGTVAEPTRDGFCGTPMVCETALGPALVGIHVAGNSQRSALTAVVPQEALTRFFAGVTIIDVGDCDLTSTANTYVLQGLDDKSCFRYISEGSVSLFGSLKGPRSSPTSKVEPTIIAPYLSEHHGFQATHGPPLMRGYKPIHHAVKPMVEASLKLPHSLVVAAVSDYFDTVTQRIAPVELQLLQKLSLETVINGADGIRGIDKINMNTSAGFPHKVGKKTLFTFSDDKYSLGPELAQKYAKGIAMYKRGRRCNFVFTGALKDEPREHQKIAEGKTRVFTGQNVTHLIIGRQYYLSFIRVMQRNNIEFENAVGCNAHSADWDKIANYLVGFAETMFDGDYKNYDKSMMAMVIMEIFDGIIQFHRDHAAMDEEDFIIMRGVAYDIAFAYVDFFGDLVSFLRNNPSGHLLTVIVNSICGSVYLRIGYTISTGKPIRSFRDDVRPITYGDDVIAAIAPSIASVFNFKTYRDAMAKFDIVFTPASKDGSEYETKTLDEVDFLKRTFVYNHELERYISPLADKSIKKSLMVSIRSSSITAEEQIVATLSSAHREAWQHGRDYFQEFGQLVEAIISHHHLEDYVKPHTFLTYAQLENYYRGSAPIVIGGGLRVLPGDGYEPQSSWVSARVSESDHPPVDSYCVRDNRESVHENGSAGYTYQSAPQNVYPGVVRLVAILAILLLTVIAAGEGHSPIAQKQNEYKTTEETIADISSIKNVTLMTSDAVSGGTVLQKTNVHHSTSYSQGLCDYLQRPVELFTYTITPEVVNDQSFNLFTTWRDSAPIKNKLQNYPFIRGTMCLRVQVDASPMVYGGCLVNIAPGELPQDVTEPTLTYHSQKKRAIIDFARNVDCMLTAQLLHATEWVDLRNPGPACSAHILMLQMPTSTTAGTTVVTVRVFAWMTEVELYSATNYTIQSEDVTIHAKQNYAHAQRTHADASLRNASLSPNLNITTTMQQMFDTDPIVTTFDWLQSDATGYRLITIAPHPEVLKIATTATPNTPSNSNYRIEHPLSFFSRYFRYWRGSLKFKFKVFCSPHHAGSLRLFWDPIGATNDTTPATPVSDGVLTTVLSKIWNIRDSDEMEFVVPHEQAKSWLLTNHSGPWNIQRYAIGDSVLVTPGVTNGMFGIKVFTRLTSPATASTVRIMMTLQPGDDFEFAQLVRGPDHGAYQLQSDLIGHSNYMGESFTDLKDILRRPSPVYVAPTSASAGPSRFVFPLYPQEKSYEAGAPWPVAKVVTVGPTAGWACNQTMMARLISAHVGVIGSVNWTATLPTDQASTCSIGHVGYGQDSGLTAGLVTNEASNTLAQLLAGEAPYMCGREIFNPGVNPVHEVRIPSYFNLRYVDKTQLTGPLASFETDFTLDNSSCRFHVSMGEDFSLIQFKGFQRQYIYPRVWGNPYSP